MSKIKKIIGREILDSRGNPTVEVDVILENGYWDVQRYLPVLQPVNGKPWSFVMETKNVTAVKECLRRSVT